MIFCYGIMGHNNILAALFLFLAIVTYFVISRVEPATYWLVVVLDAIFWVAFWWFGFVR